MNKYVAACRMRHSRRLWLPLVSSVLLLLSQFHAMGQSLRLYLSPELSLGLTSGYKYSNSLKLDPGNVSYTTRLELKGGYYLNPHVSLFTGLGIGIYNYHMVAGNTSGNVTLDTIRTQGEYLIEIPFGIRYASYNKQKPFKTRHYIAAGLRACILNDARFDYRTASGGSGTNEVREEDFNHINLRFFIDGGLDVPLDYNSAILIGLSLSDGVSRNMSKSGPLASYNYGVLAAAVTLGFRFGL